MVTFGWAVTGRTGMDLKRFLMQRPVSARGTGSNPESPPTAEYGFARELRVLRAVADVRASVREARAAGLTVGLIPTMGALHEGHLSLIRRAREQCDVVVVSVFVNPAQFDEASDLRAYPRDERHDAELARGAGADVLFAPPDEEVYPPGFGSAVEVLGVSEPLEGAVRGRDHFRAVATVVVKLLNIVAPDIAYFGQKDAQQMVVIRRVVRDLDIPVRLEACPTVREPDGLAMSSRNVRMSAEERERALALSRALRAATELAAQGERRPQALLEAARAPLAECSLEPEYLELVDPETLEPLSSLDRDGLLLIAARLGETRLIDNAIVRPAARSRSCQPAGMEPALCSA
jgi:pantoate--beta-alanine ligase